ncbi:unnamed protein product [Amoebophrya sp. A25]|nr:unnamed protein product [Amoebophrya sp. A25]|eukprot:GSA25T00010030001.1
MGALARAMSRGSDHQLQKSSSSSSKMTGTAGAPLPEDEGRHQLSSSGPHPPAGEHTVRGRSPRILPPMVPWMVSKVTSTAAKKPPSRPSSGEHLHQEHQVHLGAGENTRDQDQHHPQDRPSSRERKAGQTRIFGSTSANAAAAAGATHYDEEMHIDDVGSSMKIDHPVLGVVTKEELQQALQLEASSLQNSKVSTSASIPASNHHGERSISSGSGGQQEHIQDFQSRFQNVEEVRHQHAFKKIQEAIEKAAALKEQENGGTGRGDMQNEEMLREKHDLRTSTSSVRAPQQQQQQEQAVVPPQAPPLRQELSSPPQPLPPCCPKGRRSGASTPRSSGEVPFVVMSSRDSRIDDIHDHRAGEEPQVQQQRGSTNTATSTSLRDGLASLLTDDVVVEISPGEESVLSGPARAEDTATGVSNYISVDDKAGNTRVEQTKDKNDRMEEQAAKYADETASARVEEQERAQRCQLLHSIAISMPASTQARGSTGPVMPSELTAQPDFAAAPWMEKKTAFKVPMILWDDEEEEANCAPPWPPRNLAESSSSGVAHIFSQCIADSSSSSRRTTLYNYQHAGASGAASDHMNAHGGGVGVTSGHQRIALLQVPGGRKQQQHFVPVPRCVLQQQALHDSWLGRQRSGDAAGTSSGREGGGNFWSLPSFCSDPEQETTREEQGQQPMQQSQEQLSARGDQTRGDPHDQGVEVVRLGHEQDHSATGTTMNPSGQQQSNSGNNLIITTGGASTTMEQMRAFDAVVIPGGGKRRMDNMLQVTGLPEILTMPLFSSSSDTPEELPMAMRMKQLHSEHKSASSMGSKSSSGCSSRGQSATSTQVLVRRDIPSAGLSFAAIVEDRKSHEAVPGRGEAGGTTRAAYFPSRPNNIPTGTSAGRGRTPSPTGSLSLSCTSLRTSVRDYPGGEEPLSPCGRNPQSVCSFALSVGTGVDVVNQVFPPGSETSSSTRRTAQAPSPDQQHRSCNKGALQKQRPQTLTRTTSSFSAGRPHEPEPSEQEQKNAQDAGSRTTTTLEDPALDSQQHLMHAQMPAGGPRASTWPLSCARDAGLVPICAISLGPSTADPTRGRRSPRKPGESFPFGGLAEHASESPPGVQSLSSFSGVVAVKMPCVVLEGQEAMAVQGEQEQARTLSIHQVHAKEQHPSTSTKRTVLAVAGQQEQQDLSSQLTRTLLDQPPQHHDAISAGAPSGEQGFAQPVALTMDNVRKHATSHGPRAAAPAQPARTHSSQSDLIPGARGEYVHPAGEHQQRVGGTLQSQLRDLREMYLSVPQLQQLRNGLEAVGTGGVVPVREGQVGASAVDSTEVFSGHVHVVSAPSDDAQQPHPASSTLPHARPGQHLTQLVLMALPPQQPQNATGACYQQQLQQATSLQQQQQHQEDEDVHMTLLPDFSRPSVRAESEGEASALRLEHLEYWSSKSPHAAVMPMAHLMSPSLPCLSQLQPDVAADVRDQLTRVKLKPPTSMESNRFAHPPMSQDPSRRAGSKSPTFSGMWASAGDLRAFPPGDSDLWMSPPASSAGGRDICESSFASDAVASVVPAGMFVQAPLSSTSMHVPGRLQAPLSNNCVFMATPEHSETGYYHPHAQQPAAHGRARERATTSGHDGASTSQSGALQQGGPLHPHVGVVAGGEQHHLHAGGGQLLPGTSSSSTGVSASGGTSQHRSGTFWHEQAQQERAAWLAADVPGFVQDPTQNSLVSGQYPPQGATLPSLGGVLARPDIPTQLFFPEMSPPGPGGDQSQPVVHRLEGQEPVAQNRHLHAQQQAQRQVMKSRTRSTRPQPHGNYEMNQIHHDVQEGAARVDPSDFFFSDIASPPLYIDRMPEVQTVGRPQGTTTPSTVPGGHVLAVSPTSSTGTRGGPYIAAPPSTQLQHSIQRGGGSGGCAGALGKSILRKCGRVGEAVSAPGTGVDDQDPAKPPEQVKPALRSTSLDLENSVWSRKDTPTEQSALAHKRNGLGNQPATVAEVTIVQTAENNGRGKQQATPGRERTASYGMSNLQMHAPEELDLNRG